MKYLEWGVFIETPNKKTLEIMLPDALAQEVAKFLDDAQTRDVVGMLKPNNNIKDCDTNGLILW